eukprot:CAMPEP_0114356694 /NCGR_PEP_ID=MMETSP0101-20121206/21135_1 /TAXON_ID=38822 ORGANISM="Pteridomonas danica, Strain PT" /NCGR_SAMPLE_ID=MMETSP0101 /ASSEMBLY_ACC=CAM_ASM_000211 /LENGTH=80 /DNA_ID=CAMNT_0001499217 /DNA_START=2413 /DNA_END=2655 /DNA_ORIENTATION=+
MSIINRLFDVKPEEEEEEEEEDDDDDDDGGDDGEGLKVLDLSTSNSRAPKRSTISSLFVIDDIDDGDVAKEVNPDDDIAG